jgi:hypothetical protein
MLILWTSLALLACARESSAGVIYVNSRTGDNRLNGRAPEPINDTTGPVRTLKNEQDVQLLERLAFLARREQRGS